MKRIKIDKFYELEDFENYIHLWNLAGLSGNGIILLKKIVDSIHSNNYLCPGKKLPSVLIAGDGRRLIAKAFINSLQSEDVRESPSLYLDNGNHSIQFFDGSSPQTAHLIHDIEHLTKIGESVLWRYIREGKCKYYNFMTNSIDRINFCNGLIVLTANDIKRVAQAILKEVDHVAIIESFSPENIKKLVHQILQFCGIPYKKNVLEEIVKIHPLNLDSVMQLLKNCMMLIRADLPDQLNIQTVKKAIKMTYGISAPFGEDIPF